MKDGEVLTHSSHFKEVLSEKEIVVGVLLASDRFNRPIYMSFLIVDA